MSLADSQLQSCVDNCAEKPARRSKRVLSAKTAARREKLRLMLVDPMVVVEDPELLTDQARAIEGAFKPRNGWQDWLTSEIAVNMIRINRCSRIERRMRDMASYRAIDFWEDDQALEVETLALKIEKDPARVLAKLRQSPAGLDWLLKRWRFLAKIEPKDWTVEQRHLAGRMVGGDLEVDPMSPGFVDAQVAELEAVRGRVEEADAILRGLVEADLSDESVPGLHKLRRYSRSLHRQMTWYIDQFHVEHPDRWDDPHYKPTFLTAAPEPRDIPTATFAEPEPESDETKPIAPTADERDFDKTKPTLGEPRRENDKTKPIGRVEFTATLADAVPQVVACEEVAIAMNGPEPDGDVPTKRRANPVQEVAQRRKAARRREALACGSES